MFKILIQKILNRRIRLLSIVIFCSATMLTVKLGCLWEKVNIQLYMAESLADIDVKTAEEKSSESTISQDKSSKPADTSRRNKSAFAPLLPDQKTTTSDKTTSVDSKSASIAPMSDSSPVLSSTVDLKDIDTKNLTFDQLKILQKIRIESLSKPTTGEELAKQKSTLDAINVTIDQKLQKLEKTHSELESLVKRVDETDQANMERLVEMTEKIKPEEASKILEALDLPILLDLMEAIKPSKGAAILAVMDPIKAGYLVNELAKRKKIVKTESMAIAP